MNDEQYERWLADRRTVARSDALTDRIMSQVQASALSSEVTADSQPSTVAPARLSGNVVSTLLFAAALLLLSIRIGAMVGNLINPTEIYPEIAVQESNNDHV